VEQLAWRHRTMVERLTVPPSDHQATTLRPWNLVHRTRLSPHVRAYVEASEQPRFYCWHCRREACAVSWIHPAVRPDFARARARRSRWLHEMKIDGYRAQLHIHKDGPQFIRAVATTGPMNSARSRTRPKRSPPMSSSSMAKRPCTAIPDCW
jgi:hypothetical protein